MELLTLDLSRIVCLTDDDLLRLSADNPNLRIERNAVGELELMAPAGGTTSARNARIVAALMQWNDETGLGVVFDSSGGFRLSNGAMRAPDAAVVEVERWKALSREEQEGFPQLCPDFVIELRSPSDGLPALQQKMDEWMTNGCRLAWLIDPKEGTATVYRMDGSSETISFDAVLSGEDVLPGFELELSRLR